MRDFIGKVRDLLKAAFEGTRDLARKVVPHADDSSELRSVKLYVFLFVGIIGLMIVIGVITFGIAVRGQQETLVPNLQGKDVLDALMDLQTRELYPDIQFQSSPGDDRGIVLSQRPAPGTLVKAGKRVTLRVSKGPVLSTMENFVGMSLDAVKIHLQTVFAAQSPNIIIKTPILSKVVPNTPAGRVLAQSPLPGTKLTGITMLELVVSQEENEQPAIAVGNFVGKSFQDVMADLALNNVPFAFSVRKAAKSTDQGVVTDQNPAGGGKMQFGQVLQLTMGGPGNVGKDNVFGLFKFTMADEPIAVNIRLLLMTGGEPGELLSMKHPGGPIAIPYVVPDGSDLVLTVLDKEVAREKAAALQY